MITYPSHACRTCMGCCCGTNSCASAKLQIKGSLKTFWLSANVVRARNTVAPTPTLVEHSTTARVRDIPRIYGERRDGWEVVKVKRPTSHQLAPWHRARGHQVSAYRQRILSLSQVSVRTCLSLLTSCCAPSYRDSGRYLPISLESEQVSLRATQRAPKSERRE